ncbi:hypothetical protein [Dictyobacter formicarum]|uniref:DPH-type MB domain-containing protein n=1 Tax=Dictyobacter formicarum TaxID=2778368 RepID=A0ABQ3VBV2_9CHLR|nr:hypothetical protein [Dictyobacter formicarum]GHO83597.1 hypothetical protein KSZ_16030 [Dictyobacter formicarum]
MNLERIKYQTCPYDQEEGILLTDLEEVIPETDDDGNLQYYCPSCSNTFTYCDCDYQDRR